MFFCSLLGGPVIALGTTLIASNVQSARIEERLTTVISRQADLDTRLSIRAKDNDSRYDRGEVSLRNLEAANVASATRIEGLQRDIEGNERRVTERINSLIEAIRRIQDRIGSRPAEFEPAVYRLLESK